MTREDHANGTDRLAEAVGHFPDADVIVNVQGDEPLIAPDVIDDLCRAFEAEPDLTMATVAFAGRRIRRPECRQSRPQPEG